MPLRFIASEERKEGHFHILLVATGSVASVKVPLLVSEFKSYTNVKVEVVATKEALAFFDASALRAANCRIWLDEDEWQPDYKIGDPILHIELRRWADTVLIAPCSANSMAKIANGICDNLAMSVLRALSPTTPTFVFPAMNTLMFEHPLTMRHISIIKDVIKYSVVGPVNKTLACGDVGTGAMTDWRDVVLLIVDTFHLQRQI